LRAPVATNATVACTTKPAAKKQPKTIGDKKAACFQAALANLRTPVRACSGTRRIEKPSKNQPADAPFNPFDTFL
jgi:hypothetical protein